MRTIWENDTPRPDEPLWRYLRPNRFLEALQSRMLHSPSARQFDDPFEGAVAVQPADWPVDARYGAVEPFDRAFEQLRRLTKISSWHRVDYETAAMWKLYALEGKGVAVRTTAERLGAALRPYRLAPEHGAEEPYWGSIHYVDLFTQRLRAGIEERFFVKHRAFEWEREFRVAISLRMADEFAVEIPELGIDVPFDPETLIEALYVGPAVPATERVQLAATLEAAGLGRQFTTSTLVGRPRYT